MILLGDIHANDLAFEYNLVELSKNNVSGHVYCLGDVGISYGGKLHSEVLDVMANFEGQFEFFILRGNHDDRYCKEFGNEDDGYVDEFGCWCLGRNPNVHYLDDSGGVIEDEGKRILYVPGAFSVDKNLRIARGYSYNPEEMLTKYEMMKLSNSIKNWDFDCVFSHTCPSSMKRYLQLADLPSWAVVDNAMEDYLESVRTKCNDHCQYYFGHFHGDKEVGGNGHLLYNKPIII